MAMKPGRSILHDEHEGGVILGTNQSDLIEAGGGPQYILAGNGDDTVSAGGGPDTVDGGNGRDDVHGGGGPDRLDGCNGKDELLGGAGPDALVGGNGRDVLIGGAAADVLTGGNGADVFLYMAQGDAPAHGDDAGHDTEGGGHGEATVETIMDFRAGLDRIDLSALGTVEGLSDQPSGNAVWALQQGDDALLMIDLDGDVAGDHPAEMSILLLGVDAGALGGGDFIF